VRSSSKLPACNELTTLARQQGITICVLPDRVTFFANNVLLHIFRELNKLFVGDEGGPTVSVNRDSPFSVPVRRVICFTLLCLKPHLHTGQWLFLFEIFTIWGAASALALVAYNRKFATAR